MIKLFSPENDAQLAVLRSIFEAEKIPVFVHNDLFGSLKTGLQIDLLNRKTIMVHESDFERAQEIISDFLKNIKSENDVGDFSSQNYSWFDKIRMIFEGIIFGWVMPGKKWPKK